MFEYFLNLLSKKIQIIFLQKNSHERTCKLVRKCLEEKLDNQLKRKKGIKSRFKYFLFTQPYTNILVSIILFYLFLFIGYFIVIYVKEIWIRLAFLASYIIFSLAIPIIITILTPKVKKIWDKQWKEILQKYLKKRSFRTRKTKQNKDLIEPFFIIVEKVNLLTFLSICYGVELLLVVFPTLLFRRLL